MNYNVKILNRLPIRYMEKLRQEIIEGLTFYPKKISSKFFYDETGSKLFEEITGLEEYYPARTEKKILKGIIKDLGLDFDGMDIIELGSGDHTKISLLLEQIPEKELEKIKYTPIDISETAIRKSAVNLIKKFPDLKIEGIMADFTNNIYNMPASGKRFFCFFGSTIGNFESSERNNFLKRLGGGMNNGDGFLLGLDMVKDAGVIEKAYNDEKNVTAEFNKNILNNVNGIIGADFEKDDFEHVAFYNKEKRRVEMHLRAKKDMKVTLGTADRKIFLKNDETIHTENSYKFMPDDIGEFANQAGLKIKKTFTDKDNWFSVAYFTK